MKGIGRYWLKTHTSHERVKWVFLKLQLQSQHCSTIYNILKLKAEQRLLSTNQSIILALLFNPFSMLSRVYLNNYNKHVMVSGGKGWEDRIVRKFGMDLYLRLYLKWTANKDLVYSIWNSAQHYVVAWMGGESGYMYMYG